MNSDGVEISIARCVEEIVCNLNPISLFLLFILVFFLFHVLCISNYGEQRPRGLGGLAMANKKPHPHFLSTPAPGKRPSTQVPMVVDQSQTSHAK